LSGEPRHFTALVAGLLKAVIPTKYGWITKLYLDNRRFVNYCFVCGVLGVTVNTLILYTLVQFLPLWLANFCAIAGAMVNNYYLTVGPLGYFFELQERKP